MNKVILIFAICSTYFIACNNSSQDPVVHNDTTALTDIDTLSDEEMKQYPVIEEAEVKKMVLHYKKLKHDINTNIPQLITMDGQLLKKLLRKQEKIRLISAAYLLDNDDDNVRKDDLAIIIQLVKKGSRDKVYYDINSIFSKKTLNAEDKPVCPPPVDCDIFESLESN